MNTFNRITVIILLLVTAALCTTLLVLLAFNVPVLGKAAEQLNDAEDLFSRLHWYIRAPLAISLALTVDIILILVFILEVRRPKPRAIRVERATGGEVLVNIASIADRLRYEVDGLENVLRARPKVSAKRGGVVIEMEVETAAGLDVPAQAERILETARQVVEEKLGLKLARPPKVDMRAVPYPKTPISRMPRRVGVPAEPEEPPMLLEEPSFAGFEDIPPAQPEEGDLPELEANRTQ